jgi:hypothetical protein
VRLVQHAHLAAPVALDAQKPRRERAERLVQRLFAARQRGVAAMRSIFGPSRDQLARAR